MKRPKRQAKQDAAQSRHDAERVKLEVVMPLRELRSAIDRMRAKDNVSAVIQVQVQRGGSERGPGNPDRD